MNSRLIKRYPFYFVVPVLLVFSVFFLTPMLSSFYYSLTDWNINKTTITFTGLANFKELFSDTKLLAALKNTLIYSFNVTLFRNLLGLSLALLLNSKVKFRNMFRTIFFLPFVIAPMIIGYLFKAIYHPTFGFFNTVIRFITFSDFNVDWLHNPNFSLLSTIIVDIWRTSGWTMVIYLAGLQMIPNELFEAADIDGARYFQKLRYVTLRMLAPSITINLVLSLIGTMKVFAMIIALTNGGPGFSSEVINTYIMGSFSIGLYGLGTAANILLSIFVAVIGIPVFLFLKRREIEL